MLLLFSGGLADRETVFGAIVGGKTPALTGKAADVYRGFSAPYRGLPDAGYNGMRRFPLSIPVSSPDNGNAAAQTLHYRTLLGWEKGVHFIWGCTDDVFTEAWGRTWAERMGARFDGIPDAGHFLQSSHGARVAELIVEGRAG